MAHKTLSFVKESMQGVSYTFLSLNLLPEAVTSLYPIVGQACYSFMLIAYKTQPIVSHLKGLNQRSRRYIEGYSPHVFPFRL